MISLGRRIRGWDVWRRLRSFEMRSEVTGEAVLSEIKNKNRTFAAIKRENLQIRQTAAHKVKALGGNAEDDDRAAPVAEALAEMMREGTCSVQEILEGVREGNVTQRDLHQLVKMQAMRPMSLQHIQTTLHGGSGCLSVTEVMALLKENRLGKEDLVRIVQKGDLQLPDIKFLVSKKLIPEDVADVISTETADSLAKDVPQRLCFAEIKKRLADGALVHEELADFVMSGELHPDDVSLLVSEEALSKDVAKWVLESCASDVLDAYEEAEKLSELVSKGRFTFEELEVMRAKGVLGSSLVHYLVMRNAIDEIKGEQLLEIEEDKDYFDPEQTDGEAEASVERSSYHVKESDAETHDSGTDTNNKTDDLEQPTESILKTGGTSDEGFYPDNIPRDDTFGLWEYLFEVYANRPGKEASVDLAQGVAASTQKPATLTTTPPPAPPPKVLADAAVDAHGNSFATGKRKSSTAKVRLCKGNGDITINDRPFRDYFTNMDGRCYVLSPFLATDTLGQFDAEVTVEGGGWSGQAQAVRHGIARALLGFDQDQYARLKELGLLTRDPRVVERKKPGRAKARKSFQWVKR